MSDDPCPTCEDRGFVWVDGTPPDGSPADCPDCASSQPDTAPDGWYTIEDDHEDHIVEFRSYPGQNTWSEVRRRGDPDAGGYVTVQRMIAIDPGEVYTGIAIFHTGVGNQRPWAWHLDRAFTVTPREAAEDDLVEMLYDSHFDRVVIEEFRSYPGQNTWSEVQTAWIIGVVRYHARKLGIRLHSQKAAIKIPTRAFLRNKGIELRGDTGHAKDAELHGWYRIFNPNAA